MSQAQQRSGEIRMRKPDWRIAPEGATHFDAEADVFCKAIGWWGNASKSFVISDHQDWGTDRYIERPTGWDGEGYPPIGWHGQFTWGEKVNWFECVMLPSKILARYKYGTWDLVHTFGQKDLEFRLLPDKAQRDRDEVITSARVMLLNMHADPILEDVLDALYDTGRLIKADDA